MLYSITAATWNGGVRDWDMWTVCIWVAVGTMGMSWEAILICSSFNWGREILKDVIHIFFIWKFTQLLLSVLFIYYWPAFYRWCEQGVELATATDIVLFIDVNIVITYQILPNLSLKTELHHFSLCLSLNCSVTHAVVCGRLNLSLNVRANNIVLNF
jgi:hypothetical protein